MWNIDFISQQNFKKHVRETINNYMGSFKTISLKDFNKNIIDPVKFAFDKALFGISWQALIDNEINRQRDKTNNNYIGYFHQHIFKYMDKCNVPPNGKDGGWDVIFKNPDGLYIGVGDDKQELVHTIYVEMKNGKFINTMENMFYGCNKIIEIDLSSFNLNDIEEIQSIYLNVFLKNYETNMYGGYEFNSLMPGSI